MVCVQGFPTIKIFGLNKKKPEDYNGQRTAAAMVEEGYIYNIEIFRSGSPPIIHYLHTFCGSQLFPIPPSFLSELL